MTELPLVTFNRGNLDLVMDFQCDSVHLVAGFTDFTLLASIYISVYLNDDRLLLYIVHYTYGYYSVISE